ncbi:SPOR domain-containing protein [Stakelama marina]|uniref:SPOR domain-containing protein n=1 Tax=Stakelama marina TaxID=2826939 RepID=A0A8T4IDQ0_9SPHN|nr:SPOR domain-containing protein [Stakelama marina]MBR0551984.1 SPOR domain-containing protein [Stakelama marina]
MKHFVIAAATTGILLAAPAHADVKDGVEAWQRGDYAAAVAEWRGPAEQGDADAQFNLAQAYKLGRGVPADLNTAEEWYRKAALQGHEQAEDNYGLALFQNGKHADALPWLEKSAARGEPRAEYVLGTMYFNGKAVPKDWVRAYALMTRASDGGLPQASQTRTRMDQYVSLDDRQKATDLAHEFERTGKMPESVAPSATANIPPAATVAETALPEHPKPAPATKPTPPRTAHPQVTDGGWRVQLGAFGQAGNARSLWKDFGSRIAMFAGREPYFVSAGKLTRLQVGPFASRAEAARACQQVKAKGKPCLPVRK